MNNSKDSYRVKIWQESKPLTHPEAAPILEYLRHRGLNVERLLDNKYLRVHPQLSYYDYDNSSTKKTLVGEWPALICGITDLSGRDTALQRIWLTSDGAKAPVPKPKKILGQPKGSAVRLGEPSEVLIIAEGVETTMAVYQAIGTVTWSVVSASNMESVEIPETVITVYVFADNDTNEAGQKAAHKLATRLVQSGKQVFLVIPSEPDKDWLDILVEQGASAIVNAYNLASPFELKENNPPKAADNTEADQAPSSIAEEALYGLAGTVVCGVGPHTEADPVAVLIQFLVAFGNVIGRTAYFRVEADKHYTNLFVTLVGDSSKARKGTSWGHIRRIFEQICGTWAMKCVKNGLSSGEGLIWHVRDQIEKEEPIRAKNRGPITGYEKVITDPGISDKRLLVQEGEFANVLKVMERAGNTLSPVIRNAWDTGNLYSLVKNNPAKATGAHISIIGHVTKQELLRLLNTTEAANGFGNRFCWFWVQRSKCLPEGGKLDEGELAIIAEKILEVLKYARDREGQCLSFSDETRKLWHEVYPGLSEPKPGLLGFIVARGEAQVLRFSCLYALLDCSFVIRKEHLEAALALWDYCEESARYIFGKALGDPVADTILDALKNTPDGLSRTAINNLFQRNRTENQIQAGLSTLLRLGLVSCEQQNTGGRPAEIWRYKRGDGTK